MIEPIAFWQRARQGARGHYWFCYGTPYQFINECVMRSVPNLDNDSGRWSAVGPVVDPDVPRIDYRTHYLGPDNTAAYRVWVCGAASNDTPWYENDSLHIGRNNTYTLDAANISGFNTGWSWSSMRLHGGYPTISLTGGVNTISVWMREDGMLQPHLAPSRSHEYSACGQVWTILTTYRHVPDTVLPRKGAKIAKRRRLSPNLCAFACVQIVGPE